MFERCVSHSFSCRQSKLADEVQDAGEPQDFRQSSSSKFSVEDANFQLASYLAMSEKDGEVAAVKETFVPNMQDRTKSLESSTGFGDSYEVGPNMCCLAWVLSPSDASYTCGKGLLRLHNQLAICLEVFGAKILTDDATSGLIQGNAIEDSDMTASDAAVRLGQCLCRWASAQSPCVRIQIGVHVGSLKAMSLPNSGGRCAYFGEACSVARRLATSAGRNVMVHMSKAVKETLGALKMTKLILSPSRESFLLDPETEIQELPSMERGISSTAWDGPSFAMTPSHCNRGSPPSTSQWPWGRNLSDVPVLKSLAGTLPDSPGHSSSQSFENFRKMLEDHHVDTSKFGRGQAKTLRDFYKAVALEEKSYLVVQDGKLERVVELVRISLRVRDSENKVRELRIASQTTDGGKVRIRDQMLAMNLKHQHGGRWQEVIEKCFTQRFDLSSKTIKTCLSVDMSTYQYREERSASKTIPGIMTTYRTHNIQIFVKSKTHRDMKKLGLPAVEPFTTEKGTRHWVWSSIEDEHESELMSLLQRGGVDISEFSAGAFAELYDEVYEKKLCKLEMRDGELVRSIRIIKVWLHADVLNVDHVLVTRSKVQHGLRHHKIQGRPISMRISSDMSWVDAVEEAVGSRLGILPQMQQEMMATDFVTYKLSEESAESSTFPGLQTLYTVNEVSVRVLDSHSRAWQFIGLPGGLDFTFARREELSNGESDTVITMWGWVQSSEMHPREPKRAPTLRDVARSLTSMSEVPDDQRRVPPPSPWTVEELEAAERPSDKPYIHRLMHGQTTDWSGAKRAAARICDPVYSCRDYFDDLVASFPELRLYCLSEEFETTSGRSLDDEYQRTMGALFAVYWLMRVKLDGKECFCYGLDTNWQHRGKAGNYFPKGEFEKRKAFLESTDWATLQNLFLSAGLFMPDNDRHDPDQTLALLVLMAIHDVMKLEQLLPVVEPSVGEFCGYSTGDRISDHDIALSYIIQHHPTALPSFAGLPSDKKAVICFTQCKLEYNMGWLVQAEAPPGALFRAFRKVVLSGQASAHDIAFYFVHWFVDLAGAEPHPLEGCEKFVLKFPRKVLSQFIESFAVVQWLSDSNETQVFEDYLLKRWPLEIGEPPEGPAAIAIMRLVVMAQGDSQAVVEAFHSLCLSDREMLQLEMAVTGCRGQCYTQAPSVLNQGPAMLIYYAPALMQKCGSQDPQGALMILAEVYRQARDLWPLSSEAAEKIVTVRIDALKECDFPSIVNPEPGKFWVLSKTSLQDASVQLLCAAGAKDLDWSSNAVLRFDGEAYSYQGTFSTSPANARRMRLGKVPSRMIRDVFRRGRKPP
mmetsp:Transcript_22748/g.50277  ORF Transcript_22748/g.50277 Transcript_22748/m.50277 type:complete len:1319 (+) Transcript_22748:219-4175(+)